MSTPDMPDVIRHSLTDPDPPPRHSMSDPRYGPGSPAKNFGGAALPCIKLNAPFVESTRDDASNSYIRRIDSCDRSVASWLMRRRVLTLCTEHLSGWDPRSFGNSLGSSMRDPPYELGGAPPPHMTSRRVARRG